MDTMMLWIRIRQAIVAHFGRRLPYREDVTSFTYDRVIDSGATEIPDDDTIVGIAQGIIDQFDQIRSH